jgi:hypothetical protein
MTSTPVPEPAPVHNQDYYWRRNRLGGEAVRAYGCQKQWQVIGLVGDASTCGEVLDCTGCEKEENVLKPWK